MSARYIVFAGNEYYPQGGWHDYKGKRYSYEQALELATKVAFNNDWVQIVDLEEEKICHQVGVYNESSGTN